ncbi:hypothetical protein N7516_002183 [Penicillium verrucosum]|uniref:uncharacterized protein n=1 Tax=Penicillium verrucosum TaxID=60171 RepID=UPI0025458D1F|nr:uncharacterized protein N7516_002183 [Penicillium verrucosum]KAJ5942015.1 hypothetical protein N7516_002183 [Penicillium verrucosum]
MGANARGHTYIAVGTALVVLSTVIVGIRVAARGIKSTLGWDDYAICLSIVLAYTMLGEAIYCICFFANEISYTLLVPSIKVSILLLYRRIFSVPKFRLVSLVTGCLVLSWCLAVFITVLLQCRPISLNWNKEQAGTCINPKPFFFGNAISNLLIDVVILALPIPMVFQLQLRLSQKLTVLGIFLLGGLCVYLSPTPTEYKLIEDSVCVASVMRVVTLNIFENNDISYSIMEAATWTFVEPCVGIICACLPTMRPLLRALCCSFSWSTGDSKDAPVGNNHRMQRISTSPKNANDEVWGHDRFDDEYALTAEGSKSRVHVHDAL